MEHTGKYSISTDRKTSEKTVDSSASVKPNGKSIDASVTVMKPNEKAAMLLIDEEVLWTLTLVLFDWDIIILIDDLDLFTGYRYSGFCPSRTFHTYEEFKANCDSRGDLYDYVGHMKLVNGQRITDHMILDEVDIAEKRHLFMKLYLWDKAAADFCQKFKSYGSTPSVLLVTTVNPKHLGGTLALTSMSSSRVFMDVDVQPTKDYLDWLNSNSDIANRVAAEVVTKPETMTLEELFSYIKQDSSKVAWFECMATIYDVTEVTGVPQYLTRISLVANYFEANGGLGADHCVPVPQALLDTIGQTRKFIVKVSDHNLIGKTQTITITKILPPKASLPSTVGVESGSSGSSGDTAGDRARKADEILEADEAKRPKSG
ncbi:BnaC04g22370D [Brassica napus]|uniref:(rape) hypothetical protein n=1 Tax=Brassica napus TaxID=3708 RepID=A0A078HZ93_BRANA|nr:unnamed protein product [Brassica napus]CDY42669.1 BnaC04g22370D [Brassica napus]